MRHVGDPGAGDGAIFVFFCLLTKRFRERSRRLHQSECRGRGGGTSAAAIRAICATNWSSETSSGQVRVVTGLKIPRALFITRIRWLKFFLFSAAHLKSKKHHYHVKKKKKCESTGEQSQVSSAPPDSAGPSASDGCSHTSQEPSQDSRTTHKGVAVSV